MIRAKKSSRRGEGIFFTKFFRLKRRAIAYEKPLEEIANKLMRRREPQRRKVSSSQESLPAVEYKETPKTP
ncbi:hypothetical protein, partial [Pyramidobacter piscolens]|uniref:hypothetical protein n=1 Tax=Pyramidobacter piscolens TaxID=638849 RepID=UPI003AB70019